jgi:hypothetical protein
MAQTADLQRNGKAGLPPKARSPGKTSGAGDENRTRMASLEDASSVSKYVRARLLQGEADAGRDR